MLKPYVRATPHTPQTVPAAELDLDDTGTDHSDSENVRRRVDRASYNRFIGSLMQREFVERGGQLSRIAEEPQTLEKDPRETRGGASACSIRQRVAICG
mmetsp:Transcript_11374/g.31732  ORF Transcript_11374/g.31732 Transcript_11374/m.31732 type:complete len:99 (+) Transcript_11374:377-673(+)